jgi:hypothetical protein
MRVIGFIALALVSLATYIVLARWINQLAGVVFNPNTWVLPPVLATIVTVYAVHKYLTINKKR